MVCENRSPHLANLVWLSVVSFSLQVQFLFENPGMTAPDVTADLDGDGTVNVFDLLALLAAWGTPDGDLNGDGTTDVFDLLALLSAWGGC